VAIYLEHFVPNYIRIGRVLGYRKCDKTWDMGYMPVFHHVNH